MFRFFFDRHSKIFFGYLRKWKQPQAVNNCFVVANFYEYLYNCITRALFYYYFILRIFQCNSIHNSFEKGQGLIRREKKDNFYKFNYLQKNGIDLKFLSLKNKYAWRAFLSMKNKGWKYFWKKATKLTFCAYLTFAICLTLLLIFFPFKYFPYSLSYCLSFSVIFLY